MPPPSSRAALSEQMRQVRSDMEKDENVRKGQRVFCQRTLPLTHL